MGQRDVEKLPDAGWNPTNCLTFTSRHPNSNLPLLDAAKDAVSDTATGVMDFGVSSGAALD